MPPKETWIKFRLSEEDKAYYTAAAKQEDLPLSAWIRRQLRLSKPAPHKRTGRKKASK